MLGIFILCGCKYLPIINPPVVVPTNTPPPVVVPTNTPPPVVVTTDTLVRCSMFIPQKEPKAPWITMGPPWADSTQAYARSHGSSWENDYRKWIVTSLGLWKANAVTFFADKLKGAIELEMYLCDTASPVDGHHIADSANSAIWLKNVGVTNHIPILTDSPDWPIPFNQLDAFIKDIVNAYKTARGINVIYMIGLECNRNMTVAQVVQVANMVRKYAGIGARVICCSQDMNFLKSVHSADNGIELGKEQDGHPFQASVYRVLGALRLSKTLVHSRLGLPLDQNTGAAYISQLDQLALLVGKNKVWADEWWAKNDVTRRDITRKILAKGYNCGCGQFN